jgi:hypothetical protein
MQILLTLKSTLKLELVAALDGVWLTLRPSVLIRNTTYYPQIYDSMTGIPGDYEVIFVHFRVHI